MKYRTKLYISLVAVALASILLALIIFSTETEKLIFHLLESRSLSIVSTTAAQIDPELVKKGNAAKNFDDPDYLALQRLLWKVKNSNQRDDVYISDIYTLYFPSKKDELFFGVDVAVNPDPPGSIYIDSDKENILKNRNHPYVVPYFVSDQFGLWLSAYAPIKDEDGLLIALLGIDINAKDIHIRSQQLIKYATWGLIGSLALAILLAYFLSKRVTKSLDHLCVVVKEIGEGNLEIRAAIQAKDEFGVLSHQINQMSIGLQQRERLKTSFARYVSKHVMEKILHAEAPLKLEGERRKLTVLFADIRAFTLIAENLPPEEVVALLNEYFEVMIEVIFANFGTLDKFIGDGLMAEFGAPLDDANQEVHAIQAAIEMQKELEKLCDRWEKENKPRIKMGIGIHTGDAVVGNIGSERRTEYTAIGDAVNVASRLEEATKILKKPILISETTYLGAKDKFSFEDLGFMTLPGRKEHIKVYTPNHSTFPKR